MKALFLGDSITYSFKVDEHFPDMECSNQGISGWGTDDLLLNLKKEWFDFGPEVVFLCIGTNDLARVYVEDETIENVRQIMGKTKEYSPSNCRVFVTSVFPTRHNPPRYNPHINSLNARLHTLAVEEKVTYFHINPFFADTNGQLKREFTDDGLHLTDEAYLLWKHLIDKVLEPSSFFAK